MSFFEECWEEREEVVYKKIFHDLGPGIYPLTNEVFGRLGAESIDPRWLHYGVFKCSPTADRPAWAYVTSGMSNPWEDDSQREFSGLGTEFVMETEEEAVWAIEVLQTLSAYNILLSVGKMGDFPPLDYGHRVPLKLSESISTMLFTSPKSFPDSFNIKSGRVDLIQVVGITPSELQFAKTNSSDDLRSLYIKSKGNLITSKNRESVV